MKKLIKELTKRLNNNEQVIMAIDGPCASGKSTLAEYLNSIFPSVIYHMDDFFLPEELKTKERLKQIGGNVHYERFEEDVLSKLENETIVYQKYNCKINDFEMPVTSNKSQLIIIEGAYSLHSKLRNYYNFKVLLKVDKIIQLKRLKERSPEHIYQRFINEWIPLEEIYFNSEKLVELVDLVVSNNINKI